MICISIGVVPLIISTFVDFKTILFFVAFGIPLILVGIDFWIAFSREIQLTEEGCTIKILGFTKLYRWEQLKTKKKGKITLGWSTYTYWAPTYNGLLLSHRKGDDFQTKFYKGYPYRVPTLHPFSLVFIQFKPCLNPKSPSPQWFPKWMREESGYFADERELLSLLHSWGVTLYDE